MVEEMLRCGDHPPIVVLKPFPLVIPTEVAQRFLDAVDALDKSR